MKRGGCQREREPRTRADFSRRSAVYRHVYKGLFPRVLAVPREITFCKSCVHERPRRTEAETLLRAPG